MRLSTDTTPGADQACRSASSFSAQDRTVPLSVTLPPSTSTVMFLASNSAVRTNASSIFFFSSDGETLGLTQGAVESRLVRELRRLAAAQETPRPGVPEKGDGA